MIEEASPNWLPATVFEEIKIRGYKGKYRC
jgi:hypothetical protein